VTFRLLLLAAATATLEAQQFNPPATCQARLAEDFAPMTRTERAAYYFSSIAGPPAMAFTVARTVADHAAKRPSEWSGPSGFGLKLASDYAERIISQSFEHGYALGLHQDNRYFGSGKHGVGGRLAYALASTVLARRDNGTRTISISAIGGTATGAFISRAWQPRSNTTLADGAVEFGFTMGIRAGFNVVREFAPRLLWRVVP
jgi:hypothetical protein